MRKITFANGYYYHIYNRGVDKREVFTNNRDYFNFLIRLRDFNNDSIFEQRLYAHKEPSSFIAKELGSLPRLMEIICYCLIPNHYHLLLKQLMDRGIGKFLHKIGTGYVNYFNKTYNRNGVLFQGKYKAVEVVSDEQLLYLSAYINGNAEIRQITKATNWPWSSYLDYLGERQGTLCRKEEILNGFENLADYKNYLDEVIKNSGQIKEELRSIQIE